MTVPSQYKGFSKLPEEVQRKMSPELAEKYNMGGDVLQRPLFRQMGGPADAMPANQAMPPAPMPMAQGPDPMLQQAEAQMQGVGEQFAQQTMANIDQAEDIEGAINALRGNAKPIEARYDELAGFVGQGDAQQTPESVLAMVQPTIMMTEQGAMDSGIGQLIQSIAGSDMETPTGEPTAMGQGVGELMAMGAGNTPPVNFNQGGPVEVRRFENGGVAERAAALKDQLLPLYEQIYGSEAEKQAELEEAKRFQRGQAGLDLAKFGLALASPTDQPMSFAEKLAAAGQPLATSLGERASAFQKAQLAQKAQGKQAQAAALQTAVNQAFTEQAQTAAQTLAEIKKKEVMIKQIPQSIFNKLSEEEQKRILMGEEKTINGIPRDIFDKLSDKDQKIIMGLTSGPVKGIPEIIFNRLSEEDQKRVILGDPDGVNGIPRDIFNRLNEEDQKLILGTTVEAKFQDFYKLNDDGSVDVKTVNISTDKGKEDAQKLITDGYSASSSLAVEKVKQDNRIALAEKVQGFKVEMFDKQVNKEIEAEERALGYKIKEEARDLLYFEKRLKLEVNAKIAEEERALGRQLDQEERNNIENDRRKLLEEEIQIRKEIRAVENRDNIEVRELDGQLVVFDKTKTNEDPIAVFGEPDLPEPEIRVFTLQQNGKTIRVFEDINSSAGQALLQQVNEQNKDNPGSASFDKPTTIKNTPKGYFIPDEGVRMSYDGGKTYVNLNGEQQNIPGGAFTVSDTIAYDVMKKEKLVAHSKKSLEEMDQALAQGIDFFDTNGVREGDMATVINAYESARKGTGLWSKVMAAIDAVVGGVSAGKISLFKDTMEARKFVTMVRVLGRSALSVSPRFAVADLQTVEQLFPNEQAFLKNPETEAKKLITLRQEINREKVRILQLFAKGAPMDSTQASVLNQKLFEINRLNSMLGPIDTIYESEITDDAIKEAENIMKQSVNKKK